MKQISNSTALHLKSVKNIVKQKNKVQNSLSCPSFLLLQRCWHRENGTFKTFFFFLCGEKLKSVHKTLGFTIFFLVCF